MAKSGRDTNGRFVNGHPFVGKGGGRPSKADRDDLRRIIDANVSQAAVSAAWHKVEDVLRFPGNRGWLDVFKLYLEYRYGKPSQYMDVAVNENGDEELTDAERAALRAYLAAEGGEKSTTDSG